MRRFGAHKSRQGLERITTRLRALVPPPVGRMPIVVGAGKALLAAARA